MIILLKVTNRYFMLGTKSHRAIVLFWGKQHSVFFGASRNISHNQWFILNGSTLTQMITLYEQTNTDSKLSIIILHSLMESKSQKTFCSRCLKYVHTSYITYKKAWRTNLYSTYCLIICFYQGSVIPDIRGVTILDSNQQG